MQGCVPCLVAQLCSTFCNPMDGSPPGFSVHGDSPGKNTGVGCQALLRGIFPTQELNPGLSHCRHILYCLNHQGSPRILEWVAYSFSRGTSQPNDWSGISCIVGKLFTNWATQEAQGYCSLIWNNMKFSKLAKHFESVNSVKESRSMQVIFLCFKMWNI